jgi:hypothetical protein
VPAPSKVWVCGHSLAAIVGSNPAGSIVFYAVRQRSLHRDDHTFEALLTNAVCLNVFIKPL